MAELILAGVALLVILYRVWRLQRVAAHAQSHPCDLL